MPEISPPRQKHEVFSDRSSLEHAHAGCGRRPADRAAASRADGERDQHQSLAMITSSPWVASSPGRCWPSWLFTRTSRSLRTGWLR